MRIIEVSLRNFASYKQLEFEIQNQGLTLIHGATGSGKSTLFDTVPWILFGHTSKDGAVDEVRQWSALEPTFGRALIEVNDKEYFITRIRGQSKDNDLFYHTTNPWDDPIRGKDLNDTQKLINNLLGINSDLYLAGAYYHELSQTSQFFQTTAKNRRSICEQLVDLDLPKAIQERSSEERRRLKTDMDKLQTEISKAEYKIEHISDQADTQQVHFNNWEKNRQKRLETLHARLSSFSVIKINRLAELQYAYLQDLERLRKATVCSECGAKKAANLEADSPIRYRIEQEKARENTFAEQIRDVESEINPFTPSVSDNKFEVEQLKSSLTINKSDLNLATEVFHDLTLLSDVVNSFRAVLISNTISNLEASTNKFLSDYFDAEIRVSFSVEEADKVEVSIFKDGNACVYTQLSKGQRCLLKLCFAISVMREVANHHGVKFHQVFFDEALDGLDSDFKLKALSLLQSLELEYESIFLVEHSSEIKASCNNSYNVCLVNGNSVLNEQAG